MAIRDAERRRAISSALFLVPASADNSAMHIDIKTLVLVDRADGRNGSPFLSLQRWIPDV